eukprot:scaffold272786_cov27-Tisochrysis_lutea.AAC.1
MSETGVETITKKPDPTWIHRETFAAPETNAWGGLESCGRGARGGASASNPLGAGRAAHRA